MTDFDREKVMREWDSWRKYIAEGGKASWPRDAFEALLDFFDEQQTEIEQLRAALGHEKQLWAALRGTEGKPNG
jgi:hypothetical protein